MVTYIPLQHITLKALVWLWTHCEIQKSIVPVLLIIGLICSYKGLILDLLLQDETFVGANKTDTQWISLLYRRVQKIEQIKPDHCDRYQNNRTKKCN